MPLNGMGDGSSSKDLKRWPNRASKSGPTITQKKHSIMWALLLKTNIVALCI